jgi:DNA-binding Lrp family transcriptional regulator
LRELDKDCRTSYQDISRKIGITANAVRNRIKALEETGVIAAYRVIPSNAFLDADLIIAFVSTDGSEDPDDLLTAILDIPETNEAGRLICAAGNMYHLAADCIGITGLADYRTRIAGMPSVKNVEIHTMVYKKGKRRDFTNLELRVLRWLLEDARMSISDLAEKAGLTARRVRSVIDKLMEDEVISITIRWALNAGGSIEFFIRTIYDTKKTTYDRMSTWFEETFQSEFWYSFPSATERVIFARFVVTDFRRIQEIERDVASSKFVEDTQTMVSFGTRKSTRIGTIRLKELVREAGY